jgi:hypothetical protein
MRPTTSVDDTVAIVATALAIMCVTVVAVMDFSWISWSQVAFPATAALIASRLRINRFDGTAYPLNSPPMMLFTIAQFGLIVAGALGWAQSISWTYEKTEAAQ